MRALGLEMQVFQNSVRLISLGFLKRLRVSAHTCAELSITLARRLAMLMRLSSIRPQDPPKACPGIIARAARNSQHEPASMPLLQGVELLNDKAGRSHIQGPQQEAEGGIKIGSIKHPFIEI